MLYTAELCCRRTNRRHTPKLCCEIIMHASRFSDVSLSTVRLFQVCILWIGALDRGMERGRENGGNKTLTLSSFLILDKKAFNFVCLNKQNKEESWRPWSSFLRHLSGIFSEAYGISSRRGLQLWTGDRQSLDGERGRCYYFALVVVLVEETED